MACQESLAGSCQLMISIQNLVVHDSFPVCFQWEIVVLVMILKKLVVGVVVSCEPDFASATRHVRCRNLVVDAVKPKSLR